MNNPLKYIDPDGRNPITPIRIMRVGVRSYRTIKAVKTATNSKTPITLWEVLNSNQMVEGDRSEEVRNSLLNLYNENKKHQDKKDREAKEKLDADQAKNAQAIEDNITGTLSSGDLSPKRPPKGKVGKVVIGGGLLAEMIRSIFFPEPPKPN